MLDVYKFLEEKKKPTLPPGIVDLSSAPRVSMPAPRQESPSVPMPYTSALDKVRQLAPAPPAPDMRPTVQPIQPQADLMRSFRALETTLPTPEQQRVVEQLKAIAKPPATVKLPSPGMQETAAQKAGDLVRAFRELEAASVAHPSQYYRIPERAPAPVEPSIIPTEPSIISTPSYVKKPIGLVAKEAIDAFKEAVWPVARGLGKFLQAPYVLKRLYKPILEDPEIHEATKETYEQIIEEFAKKPETAGEQMLETIGSLVPFMVTATIGAPFTAGPVAASTGKILVRYLPKFARSVAGKAITRGLGSAALGGTISAGRQAFKAALVPEEFDFQDVFKEVAGDIGSFFAFGAAGELAGKPVREGILRVMPAAVRQGKVTWNLVNLLSAAGGGAATGATIAATETALNFMKNPKEFDAAQAQGDILSTMLFFAGVDVLFALTGMAWGRRGWTYGQDPTGKIAAPAGYKWTIHKSDLSPGLRGHVFIAGTFDPVKHGYQEIKKGMGVWVLPGTGQQIYEMRPLGEWYVPRYEMVRNGVIEAVVPEEAKQEIRGLLTAPVQKTTERPPIMRGAAPTASPIGTIKPEGEGITPAEAKKAAVEVPAAAEREVKAAEPMKGQWRKPNIVFREVRGMDGQFLGIEIEPYDGTKEGAIRAAKAIEARLDSKYPDWSNINSRIGATDAQSMPKYTISPNLQHVADVNLETPEARYIWGDVEAIVEGGLKDDAAQEHKKARLAAGKRVERGEVPEGIDIPKREEATKSEVAPAEITPFTGEITEENIEAIDADLSRMGVNIDRWRRSVNAKTDLDAIAEKYPNIFVRFKDVNGQRHSFPIKEAAELVKIPEFTDRIREAWIHFDKPHTNHKEFIEGMREQKIAIPEETAPTGIMKPIEGVELQNNSTISKGQQAKFVAAVSDPAVRSALQENNIKRVVIEPPYKFGLSEQGKINLKAKTIQINADADDPRNTILHEIGHVVYKNFSAAEKKAWKNILANIDNKAVAGYKSLGKLADAFSETYAHKGEKWADDALKSVAGSVEQAPSLQEHKKARLEAGKRAERGEVPEGIVEELAAPEAKAEAPTATEARQLWQQGYDRELTFQGHDPTLINDPNYQEGIQAAKQREVLIRDNYNRLVKPLWRVYFSQSGPPIDEQGLPVDFKEHIITSIFSHAKEGKDLPQGIYQTTISEAQKIANQTGHVLVFINPLNEQGIPVTEFTRKKYAIELPWKVDKQKGIMPTTMKYTLLNGLGIGNVVTPKKYSGLAVEEQSLINSYEDWKKWKAAKLAEQGEGKIEDVPAAPAPETKVAAKEPWEMTLDEYNKYAGLKHGEIQESLEYQNLGKQARELREQRIEIARQAMDIATPGASTKMDAYIGDAKLQPWNIDRFNLVLDYVFNKRKDIAGKVKPLKKQYEQLQEQESEIQKQMNSMLDLPTHEEIIKQALAEGKPVPPEVLEDYSWLKPAEVEPETKPAAKEPWEMTREEYVNVAQKSTGKDPEMPHISQGTFRDHWEKQHRDKVKDAIQKGKPVPSEVLADYPELTSKETTTEAETVKPKTEMSYDEYIAAFDTPGVPTETLPDAGKPATMETTEATGAAESTPAAQVASFVKEQLSAGRSIDSNSLFEAANKAYGGTMAEGKYSVKDAYDAMELGINKYLAENRKSLGPYISAERAAENLKIIEEKILNKIPTQTKRTAETDEFQQFSTPPNLAYVANWVANIYQGDTVLEPSAGTGGLAIFAKRPKVTVIVNELSPRRAAILKELNFDRVFTENAEQLDNILPDDVKPTVIVMNPPFSATAGRMEGKRSTKFAEAHIGQALSRLEPGGRLVAIVGRGMADDAPAFRQWWNKIKGEYNVRANIGIDGKNYKKYGTQFDVQLLVIDKTGPTTEAPITDKVENLEDVLSLLEAVKNEREAIPKPSKTVKPTPDKPEVKGVAAESEAGTRPRDAVHVPTDSVGARRSQRESDRPGEQRGETRSDRDEQLSDVEDGKSEEGAKLPGRRRPGSVGKVDKPGSAEGKDLTEGSSDISGGKAPVGRKSARHDPEGRIEVESKESERVEDDVEDDFGDSVYSSYKPQRLKIKDAKGHPAELAQSAAMAAVDPPPVTYSPNLPQEVITTGKLSLAQLEAVVYAGQAHEQILPNGVRRGFFIGDGTGVGKGREISGIILDNMRQGRKKHVWVSINKLLLEDAKRDFSDIGGNANLIFDFGKIKQGVPIRQSQGILFVTYDTLGQNLEIGGSGGLRTKEGKLSRLDQIVEWLGDDFDGVIAFDEAHSMRNSIAQEGARGKTKPAIKAISGVELQRRLPNARVVYVSATGATEVHNLAYADRLGLWGEGTPFADKNDFIAKIQTGGLAAMELVARDMKAMGVYLARNISFDGVSYETAEHKLTPEQAQIYDTMAEGWQIVLQNMHKALELTGQNKDARARGSANAQFWAAHQRFFNQVLTSMQMPTVIERVKTDIKNGNAVVMQLVNTNEAAMNRRIAAMDEDQTLDEIDLTPRDMLMQYLDHSFPVQQYEEYIDEDGNKRARLVVDSHGNPVINKEALAIKEELLGKIGAMKVPDGPLEMVLNTFGPEMVAEITGRSRRIVKKRDEETGRMKKVLERRSERHRKIDTDAFMNDKKRILIFSDAGGTGRSYHADKTKKNQRKRIHYLIQPGWRADGAVQGFGRTHRSNQASAPHYVLVTTNLKGQKRFISSIARRLDQLGALTKGQRQTGGQGLFSAKDNLESDMARDALNRFYIDLVGGNIPDLNPKELLRKMGLEGLVDKHGNLNQKSDELRNITRFLNRVLSLDSSLQNQVFDEFASRLDLMVEAAINAGTLDFGLENYRADKVAVKQEQTVFVEEKSGAETKYFELDVAHKNTMLSYKTVMEKGNATHGFYRNTRSKRVYALRSLGTTTSASGRVIQEYWVQGQTTNQFQVITKDELDKVNQKGEPVWEKIPDDQAPGIWSEELEKAPKYRKEKLHLISGTLLPIWDRLPEGKNRVIRIKADDGRILLGRLIGERAIGQVLKRLGADAGKIDLTPQEIVDRILESGYTIHLANQWRLKRSRVSGENRIEIIGDDLWKFQEELEKAGTFSERIQFTTRFFIPTGDKSAEILGKIIKNRPVVEAEAPAKATSPTEVEPEAKPEAEVKPAEPTPAITGKTATAKAERGTAIEAEKPKPEEPEAKGKPSEPFSMTNRTMQPFPTKKDPLSLFKKTIPKKHKISTLENLVVRNGIAYGTNLEITVAAKTDLEDGIYKITGREGSLRAVKVDGDLDEYPDMSIKIEKDAPRDVLDIGKLRPALQRSLDYVGDDKVSAVLKNISLTVKDGEMSIVASDAYRMTVHKAKSNLPDGQYLITSDAVKLLLADKSTSKAELVYGKKEVAIDTGNAVISYRKQALTYPEIINAIPKEVKTVLLADKKDFLAKIKEVKEMKPKDNMAAVVLTDKGLEIKSHSSISNKEFTVTLPAKHFKGEKNTLLEPLETVDLVLPLRGRSGERSLLGSKTEDAALLNLNYVEKAVKHIEGSDAYMSFAGNYLAPVLFTGENPIGEHKKFLDTETLATAGTGKAEKKLDQVMTELGEEVDRVVGDTNFPIGQTVRIVGGSPAAAGTFSSADPEIDARVKASHGVKSPSTFSKIRELMGSLARMASREYEHLPRGKEFAPVRFELLRLAKQRDVATTKTLKTIQGILVDFINDPKAYNHFEWKVLLNDLAEEAKAGHELPFGYTEEKLNTDIKRLDEALKDYPQVTRAVEKRRKVWDAIVDAYIEAQEAIGFKVEDKLTKKDYYRHMVLDYANKRKTPSGTGKKLRTPTGAFYLKHREGSTLDINTNYLEAEYEVMAQMLYDIERSKVIKFIDDEANIINDLKGRAKSTNHSNIMKHFEQMAKRMNEGKDPDKWVTAEDMYRRTLNKKQAMGFNRLAEMAEEGELPGGDDPKWSKAIDALASGEENDNTMAYLSWLVRNHGNTEAGGNAALVFRGIHEKDRYIRETLGNKFVTWEDIIPEGYTTWQPREGNVFFFADTIPSQYAEEQLAKGMVVIGVPKNKIRQILAVGRKLPEMVVREELAMTLDNLTKDRPLNPVSDFFKRIMGAWKEYQLISPKRWAKYNIRNISGDAEPAYIGNPSTFTKVPRAAKELYHVYFGDGAMTKDMRDWFERGGMQSLLTVQEMGDVNQLRMFVNLMEKRGKITEIPTRIWQGYWKAARLSTNYREAILRYAAYLDYREQIKAGKGKPKNFGASDPEEVMALKSDEDKAYWLSNDLLGAYDRVSVIGKWLREYLMPFWSYQEINFKRYIQFVKNAARDEKTAEMVGRIAASTFKTTLKRTPFIAYRIGKFLIKAVGVWAALDTYNKMRWPDEEKELPPDVRNTPHIVLGRSKNGEVLYFDRLGSLSDFLEWFGLEESPALVGDFLSGKKNLKEIVTEMAKGSANKVIQAVGPQHKIPAELIMGRKVFPDAFEPGMIRDGWYYVFQSLDLDEEYSAIFKLPRKPYMETLKNFLVYSQEPGQGAYYEILDLKREFQKKIGKASGFMSEISPKSRALYNLKLAIRYQDAEAMKRYAAEYVSHGGTADGLKTSLRNMHPLHGLKKAEEKAFIAWLDEEDRERLILAMEYYDNVLKGERSKPKEEKQQEGGK